MKRKLRMKGWQIGVLIGMALLNCAVLGVGVSLVLPDLFPTPNADDRLKAHLESVPISTPQPTPRPATATSRPPLGIGVSLNEIRSRFRPLGYNIDRSSDVRGQPRYFGMSPNGTSVIEVMGSANDLTYANIIIGLPRDVEVIADNMNDMFAFLQATVPDWKNSSDWLGSAWEKALNGEEVRTTYGSVSIVLRSIGEGTSLFSLSLLVSPN